MTSPGPPRRFHQDKGAPLRWRSSRFPGQRILIVIHFGPESAQAGVLVPWDELRGKTWRLADALSDEVYDRSWDEMRDAGLYFDLGPWTCHIFKVSKLP